MGNRRSNPDTLRNLIYFVTLSRQGADEPGMCQVDLFQTDPAKVMACTMCGDYCAVRIVNRHFKF